MAQKPKGFCAGDGPKGPNSALVAQILGFRPRILGCGLGQRPNIIRVDGPEGPINVCYDGPMGLKAHWAIDKALKGLIDSGNDWPKGQSVAELLQFCKAKLPWPRLWAFRAHNLG